MFSALMREMKGLVVKFNIPIGGMFLWLRMPEGIDTVALLGRGALACVMTGARGEGTNRKFMPSKPPLSKPAIA
jgi:DNA-binding transcriptional MocR family regulator